MTSRDAFIAVNRFGLGNRDDELKQAATDPKGWVAQQLSVSVSLPAQLTEFPSSETAIVAFQEARKKARRSKDKTALKAARKAARRNYLNEAIARTQVQIETRQPVVERLVAFWSNHFTVSVQKPLLTGIAGAFEREAIRPYVNGRFVDMLRAAIRHPAMLVYLDNVQSIGPNSKIGQRRKRGLNENLAREVLELHTLGVHGGYTQADVQAFAKMLTGWSVGRKKAAGGFVFHEQAHEPGSKTLLGTRYAESGAAEAEAALVALAQHPSTARHIAFKLARHFTKDKPSDDLVKTLAKTFLDTSGDLRAVMNELIRSSHVWITPLPKVKTPNEYIVSALRAAGMQEKPRKVIGVLRLMGQMPFAAPSPAGWPDEAAKWISPNAMMQRAELAMAMGQRIGGRIKLENLVTETIEPVATAATRAAIRRAPDRLEAIATLFASPEFQRR